MKILLATAAFALHVMVVGVAAACEIAQPKGAVILSVGGMINACNQGLEVLFDKQMIEAMPKTVIKTENPWEHGLVAYEGVLLRDILKFVRADGKTLTISALNDYRADLSVADAETYDVILAYKREGADIPVREKGPLFAVFPFTDIPALATEARFAQSVWQVNRITVK